MSILKLAAATVAAATLMTSGAGASPISLSYNGPTAGFGTVDLDQVPVAVAGNQTQVSAGGFNMTDTSGGLGDFIAWCLDLGAYLGTSGANAYQATNSPFQNGGADLLAAGMARVQAIFDANYGASVESDQDSSTGFQLALWEAVYDTDMNIGTGAFQASSSFEVEAAAEAYLTAAMNYSGKNIWELTYLESVAQSPELRRQNLVTASLAPVPLPASGIMMIVAIGGFGAVARKRRKKA